MSLKLTAPVRVTLPVPEFEACRVVDVSMFNEAVSDPEGEEINRNDPEALSEGHKAAAEQGNRADPRYGGNCTPDEHDSLRDLKDDKCGFADQLGGCNNGSHTQMGLQTRLVAWTECANARDNIRNQCFSGGNQGHVIAANKAWELAQDCASRLP